MMRGSVNTVYQMQKTLAVWQSEVRNQLIQTIDNPVVRPVLYAGNLF